MIAQSQTLLGGCGDVGPGHRGFRMFDCVERLSHLSGGITRLFGLYAYGDSQRCNDLHRCWYEKRESGNGAIEVLSAEQTVALILLKPCHNDMLGKDV